METMAAWEAGWYALDQPIQVGLTGEFRFWSEVPEYLQGIPQSLVFHNSLWNPEEVLSAHGTILSIEHNELGQIKKIDTRTEVFDYIVVLSDNTELLVNSEEHPGKIYEFVSGEWTESSRTVADWTFEVRFAAPLELKSALKTNAS